MSTSYARSRGRHRRCGWRSPAFAVKIARRMRARCLAARDLPYRPARQIAIEVRRRENARIGGGWGV